MSFDVGTPNNQSPASSPASSHRILRNSTLNLIAQFLNAGFHVIVVLTLARGLEKEDLGAYYNLFAWVMVVQVVCESAVSTVMTRRLAQSSLDKYPEIIGEGAGLFTLIVAISALTLIVVGLLSSVVQQDPSSMVNFCAAGIACAAIQVQRYCAAVFRASEQFGYENIGRIIQGAVLAGLVWISVRSGRASVAMLVIILAISHIVVGLYLMERLHRHLGGRLYWRWNLARCRHWLGEAIPLGLGDVMRGLTWQLDTILLGWMQPKEVVGIYSVAYRPLGPLNWVPRAVLAAAFPAFARMASSNRANLQSSFSKSVRLLWIISLPLAVGIGAYAKPMIQILTGQRFPEYEAAIIPLRILIWITSLSFLSTQFRFIFTAVGKQNILTRLVILVFFVEAAIETALIPYLSYYGACTGSLVGEIIFTIVGLVLCRRLGIGTIQWPMLFKSLLAAAVMGAILWPARNLGMTWLISVGVLATAIYFGLCVLLGALERQDVKQFTAAFWSWGKKSNQRPDSQ